MFYIWRNILRLEKEAPLLFDKPGVERWFQSSTHFMDRSSNHLQIILPPPHPRAPSGPRRGPRGDPRGCPEGGAGAHRTHPRPRGPHVSRTQTEPKEAKGSHRLAPSQLRPGSTPSAWGSRIFWNHGFMVPSIPSVPMSTLSFCPNPTHPGAPHFFVTQPLHKRWGIKGGIRENE